jgi:hypothetical protein
MVSKFAFKWVNLCRRYATGKARGGSNLAEIGTLQMEFIALSQRTGDPQWSGCHSRVVSDWLT